MTTHAIDPGKQREAIRVLLRQVLLSDKAIDLVQELAAQSEFFMPQKSAEIPPDIRQSSRDPSLCGGTRSDQSRAPGRERLYFITVDPRDDQIKVTVEARDADTGELIHLQTKYIRGFLPGAFCLDVANLVGQLIEAAEAQR